MKEAYAKYTEGIKVKCSDNAINAKLHCNRAAINLKLRNFAKVIEDCKMCLQYDPNYIKGYFRQAKALIGLRKYKEALQVLEPRNEEDLIEVKK